MRAHVYVRTLRDAQLHGLTGRVQARADNHAIESFYSLLQKNVLNRQGRAILHLSRRPAGLTG